jgi:ABC-type nitrate/sulfonate/bicarbonate transport system permease component
MNLSQVLSDIAITTTRVFAWTSLAWLAGMLLGYPSAKSRRMYQLILPVINLFRHISPFCWLPLVIMISGIGEFSVGIILFLAMFFNALILVVEIINSVQRQYLEQAALDGASSWYIFRDVELPLIMGEFVNLYRVLWSVGWVTVIAAEMLGVSSGMGYRLLDYRYLLLYKEMLVYIALIGLIGIGTDYALLMLKNQFYRLTDAPGLR